MNNSSVYVTLFDSILPKVERKKDRKKVKLLSCVQLLATPWTVAYQVLPSMGFFRQEYWSGLPFPSPGDLPTPGIKPGSPALQADSLLSEPPGKPQKDNHFYCSVTHHYFLAGV